MLRRPFGRLGPAEHFEPWRAELVNLRTGVVIATGAVTRADVCIEARRA